MLGAKGKSALRSALDQATNDKVKFLDLMTLPSWAPGIRKALSATRTSRNNMNQNKEDQSLGKFLEDISNNIINHGYRIDRSEAQRIGAIDPKESLLLFYHANRIREHYNQNHVSLCSIVNAKSGACSEDCAFCSQSSRYKTGAPVYSMMEIDEMLKVAQQAKQDGAESFGLVTSGPGVKNEAELKRIGEAAIIIREKTGLDVHTSIGLLNIEQLRYLRQCGVTTIHHNLETSERFFPSICTTHTFQERIKTIKTSHQAGMKICSGGIFGLGETINDRIDLALTLRELDVDGIPMNFLYSVPGTPLEKQPPMPPMEILMTISLFRFILPDKTIRICGGRESNLHDLQCMIFFAGASGMMVGNYLTTAGREPELDWRLMRDQSLEWRGDCK